MKFKLSKSNLFEKIKQSYAAEIDGRIFRINSQYYPSKELIKINTDEFSLFIGKESELSFNPTTGEYIVIRAMYDNDEAEATTLRLLYCL